MARKSINFNLAPKQTKELICLFNDLEVNSLKRENLELTVTTDSGNRSKYKTKINFLNAVYRPNIKIDGDFADWQGIVINPFDPSMIKDDTKIYQGRKDLDASIAFAWNDKYLLFYVDVRDDVFFQPHSGWLTWNGDSLQMAFTKAVNYKKTGNMYQDKMDLAYSEIDFALTPKGPEVYRTITFSPKKFPVAQVALKDAPLSVKKTLNSDGSVRLQYEVAIPWSFLNITKTPTNGQCIGWTMTVNDRDQKKGALANLEAFKLKKPEQFGTIVLTK